MASVRGSRLRWASLLSTNISLRRMFVPFSFVVRLGLVAVGLLGASGARAQVLPLDERGKASFYEVVTADSLRAGVLYAHAKSWLRQRGYALAVADSAAGQLVAAPAFGLYDRGYVSRKLHGKVQYQLTVEVKDGRYRVQGRDFTFAYYREDRFNQFRPTGQTKPLEDPTAPGWQKLWEIHRHDTLLAVTALAAELRKAMLTKPPVPALSPRRPLAGPW